MSLNCKTPLSVLHEICRTKGYIPQYELVGQEGRTHEPLFTFNCGVADLITIGEGTSKKKAKHNAAQNMLIAINNISDVTHSLADLKNKIMEIEKEFSQTVANPINLSKDEKNELSIDLDLSKALQDPNISKDDIVTTSADNPIGELLEICLSNRIPPPTYTLVDAHGMAHERIFVYEACVVTFSAKGEAKSKKLAKRLAAQHLLIDMKNKMDQLKEFSSPLSPIPSNAKAITNGLTAQKLSELLDKKVEDQENIDLECKPISEYIELIDEKESLTKLRNIDLTASTFTSEQARLLLENIGKEQGFEIEHRQYNNKNNNEFPFIVYVDMSTTPSICNTALAQTTQKALEICVLKTLEVLKSILINIKLLKEKRIMIQNFIESNESYSKYYSTDSFGPDIIEIPIEEILKKTEKCV